MPKHIKLAIIGSGPAGYSSAIYSARAKLSPTVLAGRELGGQLMYTTQVENFPGFPEGILGSKLMSNLKIQAEKFGASVIFDIVYAVDFSKRPFKLWTQLHDVATEADPTIQEHKDYQQFRSMLIQHAPDIEADSVIIATGATSMMLGLENEKNLLGRGVSTCAVCDAAFFQDKKVFVIGGGDSAMEDALALAKFSSQVTIVHRRDQLKASQIMQERVINHPHIKIMWNTQVTKVIGTTQLESIEIETEGKETALEAQGLFLAIGHKPVSSIFVNQLELTRDAYVVTSQSPSKSGVQLANNRLDENGLLSLPSMTSIEGVFAAGDVVDQRYRQASTASGMGVMAALDAEKWLMKQEK